MSELGQTNDPRALIPGHLATVEADAVTLRDHSRRVGEVGRRLLDVRVDGWGGQAGPRFAQSWSRQPPAWFRLADALDQANRSLDRYLDTLGWAQDRAAAAIEMWNRGTAETEQAKTRSGYELGSEKKWKPNTPGKWDTSRPESVDIAPSADPGVKLRADAEEVLKYARERLRTAGDALARELLMAFSPTDPLRAALAPLDRFAGAGSVSGTFADGKGFITGEYGIGRDIDGGRTPDGIEGHARLAQGSFNAGYHDGDLSARAQGRAYIGTEASAAASRGPDGFTANVDAHIGAKATTEADVRYGAFTGHTDLKAEAGAGLNGALAVTKDRVKAEGGAFAGGRVGVEQSVEAGGIKVGGKAEAWAGAGVKAGFDVGVEDGKFHLSGELGAALGVGGSVGGSITIDPEEIEKTTREAADAVGRGVRELDQAASELGSALNPFD